MNKLVIHFLAIALISLFSSMAFAGGAGCDSKKGHTKPLSADALHEFKKQHGWIVSEDNQGDSTILRKKEGIQLQDQKKSRTQGIQI